MVREKEDTHYKIVQVGLLFDVYKMTKRFPEKEWTLLTSGLEQIPFCAEKFILRQHYKSNEWEHHRFSGQSIKQGINQVYPSWEEDRRKPRNEREMIAGWIYIDTTECSKEALHDFSKGYFSKYLNIKEDWALPQMDFKCKKGRLIETDALYLACPRGHKDHTKLYKESSKYQGTELSNKMYNICKMQDIYFDDFKEYINNNSLGLYDDDDRGALYEVYDLVVDYYRRGKSANQALKKAKAIFRASKKAIKKGILKEHIIERNSKKITKKRDDLLTEVFG